jgi:hypothetical protein
LLDPFFPILEKPIADRGNMLSLPRKDFFSLHLRIFSPKRLSRKFQVRFVVRESHQDLGWIPGLGTENSRKTPGWEQVHQQVFKHLGRIPGWRRGINRKTPAFEHVNKLIQKSLAVGAGKDIGTL